MFVRFIRGGLGRRTFIRGGLPPLKASKIRLAGITPVSLEFTGYEAARKTMIAGHAQNELEITFKASFPVIAKTGSQLAASACI